MDKKLSIIAIAIVAVLVIAAVVTALSTSNQDNNKDETYYYIYGNGGTHDGASKVEWKQSSLPDSDYFTKDNNHYISFNTKSDGTGDFYGRLSSDAPKGSTLYVFWEYNYVSITNNIPAGTINLFNIDFKCGTTVKQFSSYGNPTMTFGGKETNGVFDNHIDITVHDSSGATITMDGNKVTIFISTPTYLYYNFEIINGADVELIDDEGQDKGLRLTFGDSAVTCSYIEMSTSVAH